MKTCLALGIAAVALAFSVTASAAPSFLTPDQYDPARLLPPPPADGSDAAKAELAELHRFPATGTDGCAVRTRQKRWQNRKCDDLCRGRARI